MRVIFLQTGYDINYNDFTLSIQYDKENKIFKIIAFSNHNLNKDVVYSTTDESRVKLIMKEIALAYEKNQKVYFVQ